MSDRGHNEDRRFTDKPPVDPGAVRSLPLNHLALLENRTLFPSTVVDVTEEFSERLLVSGKNNRKLGERIEKGNFKGYALFGLSLEERATCPTDCDARGYCYGNGMQMARRHRITDLGLFATFIEDEIRTILADPIEGLMVRLHVLGDFPSVDYVAMWADLLDEHPRLACYGYTHRLPKGIGGDEIGNAIEALKSRHKERFRIRWSFRTALPDGAYILNHVPETKGLSNKAADAVVCPAQTDATACCASCGYCWEWNASGKAIAFIKHGPKSLEAAAESARPEPSADVEGVRAVAALKLPQKRDAVVGGPPESRFVAPTDLKIEAAYQRDLSGKSMKLIRKIVAGWDWTKFKPPVCAETDQGLFVIDGQHTAIAAASHPDIKSIPVMVVAAARIERRAEAFVSHNRDRLTMTPAQILYGDAAAGRAEAMKVLEAVARAGGSVPRLPVPKGYAKPGQITAVGELRRFHQACGDTIVERAIRIAVESKVAPITATVVSALRFVLTERRFENVGRLPDGQIAKALASIKNIEATAQHHAAETGQSRFRACAVLIAEAANAKMEAA